MASEKVTAIVEEVKNLTVLELSELVSASEEEFGVSAAAPAAAATATTAAAVAPSPRREGGAGASGRSSGGASSPGQASDSGRPSIPRSSFAPRMPAATPSAPIQDKP